MMGTQDKGLTTKDVMRAYSNIFNTYDGQLVLADILSQLGYFSNQPESIKPECIAIANTILSRCGIMNSAGIGIYMEGLAYSIGIAAAGGAVKDTKEEDDAI